MMFMPVAELQVPGYYSYESMKNEQDTQTTCSPSSEYFTRMPSELSCDNCCFNKDAFSDASEDEATTTDDDSNAHDETTSASMTTPRSSLCGDDHSEEAYDTALGPVYSMAILLGLRVACCAARAAGACKCSPAVRYGSKPDAELPACYRRKGEAQAPGARKAAPGKKEDGAWRAAASKAQAAKAQAAAAKAGAAKAGAADGKARPSLLPTSANSWAAQQKTAKTEDDKIIERQVKVILNKLTIEKFDRLYEQLCDVGVQTQAHVALIMQEVFEKATLQHHFVSMYADLCVKLEHDPRIAPAVEGEDASKGFRSLLLSKCQSAFEGMLSAQDDDLPEDEEAREEARMQRKYKALGNVKFVGELLVRGMLCTRLLCNIGENLLQSRHDCVDALESLTALLTAAAPKFDDPKWVHFQRLDGIFAQMQELTADKAVPARLRFLLRDVLDMRKRGWPNHGPIQAKQAKPMKIEEVKQMAEQEQQPTPTKRGVGSPKAKCGADGDVKDAIWRKLIITTRAQAKPARGAKEAPWSPPRSGKAARALRERAAAKDKEADAASSCDLSTTPSASLATSPAASPPGSPAREVPAAPVAELPEFPVEALAQAAPTFDLRAFRRELAPLLRTLGKGDAAVAAAVAAVCAHGVPECHQAQEFADILTRASEESSGPKRRTAFRVAAGLASAQDGAWTQATCLAGVATFFAEVYGDLKEEVAHLSLIATTEMLPALQAALARDELAALLPEELRSA
mmetsp:Transcript_46724/g.102026  ORF Transcript_46724/g.102026 Transcript_46724/m.102026 type:complete len:743 (-) Transcript_46724:699-2927(-)